MDGESFWTGFIAGIIACFLFLGLLGALLSDGKAHDKTDWKARYQSQVCKSYGRVLNTDNHDRWCMDPVTKGIFEIKEKDEADAVR
jgi:hypothetical protein